MSAGVATAAAPRFRVGLISDTHGLLRPEALAQLRGCDHILHAGDIGGPAIVDALAVIAPLVAVRGNKDTAPWSAALEATDRHGASAGRRRRGQGDAAAAVRHPGSTSPLQRQLLGGAVAAWVCWRFARQPAQGPPHEPPEEGVRMELIGMLDSPYVRRVAISLQLLGLRFEHQSLSVFRGFTQFQQINPVVKAPTLLCDDGTVLMDSTLMLQYAEALDRPRSLMTAELPALLHDLRLIGMALAATEESVQIVYERGLRPPEKLHKPWVERVTGQLLAAHGQLEQELARQPLDTQRAGLRQAHVSLAVGWHFAQQMLPEVVLAARYPLQAAFSAALEALPEFRAAPHGDAACPA
jgi:glutathione S-transferase